MFPYEDFSTFVSNAPLADAVGSNDMLALVQGRVTKKMPISMIPGLTPIVNVPVHIVSAGASYSILSGDYFIGVDKSVGSATTINLPGSAAEGRPLIIKDVKGDADVNQITIAGGTIDGVNGSILPFPYACITLLGQGGTAWAVISRLTG